MPCRLEQPCERVEEKARCGRARAPVLRCTPHRLTVLNTSFNEYSQCTQTWQFPTNDIKCRRNRRHPVAGKRLPKTTIWEVGSRGKLVAESCSVSAPTAKKHPLLPRPVAKQHPVVARRLERLCRRSMGCSLHQRRTARNRTSVAHKRCSQSTRYRERVAMQLTTPWRLSPQHAQSKGRRSAFSIRRREIALVSPTTDGHTSDGGDEANTGGTHSQKIQVYGAKLDYPWW